MSDHSGYKHDGSDKKLDQSAEASKDAAAGSAKHASSPGHDPAEIAKHDDTGKDRLFEGREQRDDAEVESERTRLSRDVNKHHHATDHAGHAREEDASGTD